MPISSSHEHNEGNLGWRNTHLVPNLEPTGHRDELSRCRSGRCEPTEVKKCFNFVASRNRHYDPKRDENYFCQSLVSMTSKEQLISGEFQIPVVTQRRFPSRFRGWPCEEHISLALYPVSSYYWPSEKYQI